MEENKYLAFLRRHWLPLALVAVLIFVLYMISQYSFIKIEVQGGNQTSAEYSYYITPQAGGKTAEAKSKLPTHKKLVRKGKYTASVVQDENSYFSFVSTSGFFTTKTISAQLKSEQSRAFVGDNPDACMEFIDGLLMSMSCNGERKTVKVHVPATATQPTYAKSADASGDMFEGIVNTQQGTVVLIESPGPDQGSTPLYTATLDNQARPSSNGRYLDQLSQSDSYNLTNYKDGFVIYNDSFGAVYYMSSINASPEVINIERPKDNKLSGYLVDGSKSTIVAAYTNQDKLAAEDVHSDEGRAGSTTLVAYEDGKSREFTLPGALSSMELCGTKKLCVVSDKQLVVYDISGKKPKELYSLSGVQDIATYNQELLVVTERNILDIDVDKLSGYVAYSFGDYQYCGIQADNTGYTFCVIDNLQRKVALRFDPATANVGSIDKKIAQLQKSPAVSVVSIYRNSIFIAPNYGQQVYVPSKKIYDYEPATVKRMNEQLEKDLASIGISRSTYTISGTQQP